MDETARFQAMDIIRSMIERIEVHASEERANPADIFVGALAQIPAFTQQTKNAASSSRDGGKVLMVAGARNCPNFLLFVRRFPKAVPSS